MSCEPCDGAGVVALVWDLLVAGTVRGVLRDLVSVGLSSRKEFGEVVDIVGRVPL